MTGTCRRVAVIGRTVAALLILSSLLAVLAVPAAAQDDYAGWELSRAAICEGAPGIGEVWLEAGPDIPPLGSGSLHFLVAADGNGFPQLRQSAFDGVALAALTKLEYSTFVDMDGDLSVAPMLLLDIDADADGEADDQLIFQPGLQGEPLVNRRWQDWDALGGLWWSKQGLAGMTADNPQLLTTYLEEYPNAAIVSPDDDGALRVAAGCIGDGWESFAGALDAVVVGVSGLDTEYDFEAGAIYARGALPPGYERDVPVFTQLLPAPHSTHAPGTEIAVGVEARSDSPIRSVHLMIDGQNVPVQVVPRAGGGVLATAPRTLPSGVHRVIATATDQEGDQFTAQWNFVVGEAGESEWFNADGTPKDDAINATMKSLVEAFRWHLFGQTWDGVNHPEMPTHVDTITQGTEPGPWVTDGTFDAEATTATLKSLVEAFRWHFWGQSWQGAGDPPNVPTHATEFVDAEPLSPWFEEDGTPIRSQIEGTLRSLVESFRWHFWGVTWDGQHHEHEMPTHAW